MNTSPKVSVITPMYNSESFISETINSVLNQTHLNWELLLIDDCSNDKTIEIASQFMATTPNIKRLKNETNLGAAISRNKGIMEAKGEYIAFLDADDLWKPNKLEIQIAFMETNQCDVCFSSYEQIDEKGNPLNKLIQALPELTYHKYLKSNLFAKYDSIYPDSVWYKNNEINIRFNEVIKLFGMLFCQGPFRKARCLCILLFILV